MGALCASAPATSETSGLKRQSVRPRHFCKPLAFTFHREDKVGDAESHFLRHRVERAVPVSGGKKSS